ncbi:hypothetical protein HN018_00720 [Lichenicola cladoniae]|uniref:Peptidase M48 domain-containing protein n=1 Tax=Lichenicola cladoniae TaxID=1484109 RepID=A0A6M8HJ97_9PROT|nr:hypothetical protein [Lichenicola cladoniae]NPD65166.1 hypothetical protein [Acetobacteraceae bacterium]QKE88768.1 hypothetical protein HN018_00720 [Lichenicola cladoniae]
MAAGVWQWRAIALLVLPPMLAGWQLERGSATAASYRREATELVAKANIVAAVAAHTPDRPVAFGDNSTTLPAIAALALVHRGMEALGRDVVVADLRVGCAAATLGSGLMACLANAIGLLAARWAFRAGTLSGVGLAAVLSRIRWLLPVLLGTMTLGLALSIVGAVLFEFAGLWFLGATGEDMMKVAAVPIAVAWVIIWLACLTLRDLAATRRWAPLPMPLWGRDITLAEAPALWSLVAGIALRQQVLAPEHIVLGLVEGCFVTSSTVMLEPAYCTLTGRTLHIAIPCLALLDRNQFAAMIGHELTHFGAEDTEYCLHVVPLHDAVGRIAAAAGWSGVAGDRMLLPPAALGEYMIQALDHAIGHWKQLRDVARLTMTDVAAAESASIRGALVATLVKRILDEAAQYPRQAPADLLAHMLVRAKTEGIAELQPLLADRVLHPKDRTPFTRQRIADLEVTADEASMAQAKRSVLEKDDDFGRSLIPGWEALCLGLSQDIIDFAAELDDELDDELEVAVAAPMPDRTEIHAAVRGGLWRRGLMSVGLIAIAALVAVTTLHTPDAQWSTLLICLVLAVAGFVLALLAVQLRREALAPFLTLDHWGFTTRGLDRAVSWTDVTEVRLSTYRITVTNFQLSFDARLPRRVSGWRVRVHQRRRVVSLIGLHPHGMTMPAYMDLIDRYLRAAHACAALDARDSDAALK